MIVESSSRWDLPPLKARISLRVKIVAILCGISATFFLCSYLYPSDKSGFSADSSKNFVPIGEGLAEELRLSVSGDDPQRVRDLVEAVSKLTLRVEMLEKERSRLTSEMNELAGDDGVIARIVTHVRSLHAKIEATRHDVVDAMMSPLPESPPSIDAEGHEPEATMEDRDAPFLTKAQHTIVTPVAASAQVAEKVAAPAKHKAKPAPASSTEGATN